MVKLRQFLVFSGVAASGVAVLSWAGINTGSLARATELQTVTIPFQARVGSQPFRCDASYELGTSASLVTPLDFRLYVSDVALVDEAGNVVPLMLEQDGRWQYDTVALLDFEDKSGACANGTVETNDRVVGTVPAGTYTGLQFTVGVPFELNHADATLAPSPLNLTSLWWNWQLGYKFVRIDLRNQSPVGLVPIHSTPADPSSTDPGSDHHPPQHAPAGHGDEDENLGFAIHLGSTGCEIADGSTTPTSCSHPNAATISLDGFDPATSVVVADLAALVATTDLSVNQPDTAPGCMSDPADGDCAGILPALGLPFNDSPPSDQTVFRLE